MIKKTERKRLKKLLGWNYTSAVLAILKNNNITNKKGNPFSASYITQVLNGKENNDAVEDAIFEEYNNRNYYKQKKQQEQKRKRDLILNKKHLIPTA